MSALRALYSVHGGMSGSSCSRPKHGPEAADRSDTFFPARIIRGTDFRELTRDAIWAAFPSPSATETARLSAGPLLSTPRTIYRVLTEETHHIDAGIALRALVFGGAKLGRKYDPLRRALAVALSIQEVRQ